MASWRILRVASKLSLLLATTTLALSLSSTMFVTASITYKVDYLLANSEFDIFYKHLKKHFLLPIQFTLYSLLIQLARELPMISLGHMNEYASVHFNAKTWVDDHVGFQVYSLEFYLIVSDTAQTLSPLIGVGSGNKTKC